MCISHTQYSHSLFFFSIPNHHPTTSSQLVSLTSHQSHALASSPWTLVTNSLPHPAS
ncbi:hypothetical protein E2C01_086085 [Portunus trituberculatus]|uniref:Uncharacterized protein n=1 Tax=Portunus trituberculatus TaxID=210409 RepID=A0A5B7J4I2_PORTR|nr:hypothetical protein [Portunus trituberculatus]